MSSAGGGRSVHPHPNQRQGAISCVQLAFGRVSPRPAARPVRRRSPFSWRSWGLALWLAHVGGAPSPAAQLIQYLQVPAAGNLISGSNFNLPNYGTVQVTIAGESATFFDQINAYNQSAGPYAWGTDTQRLGILNTTGGPVNYTLNFAFLSGCPTPTTCCSTSRD